MKIKLKEELKSKTVEELVKEVRDLRVKMGKMSIDMKNGKITDTNSLYLIKKNIARILTFLAQKPKKGDEKVNI